MKKVGILFCLFIIFALKVNAQTFSENKRIYLMPDSAITKSVFHYKDPPTALAISFGNTLIPVTAGAIILGSHVHNLSRATIDISVILIGYGVFIGPATGVYYAGYHHKALGGIGVRVLAGVAGTAGLAIMANNVGVGYSNNGSQSIIPPILYVGGAITIISSVIVQIIKAPIDARKFDRIHGLKIEPTYFSQEKSFGLAMRISF
ncbi:MAG TPA: hypothetical protein VJ991_09500 [Balneolales bacterium]|nr:hypothetical protein [Balneolales bacterium]